MPVSIRPFVKQGWRHVYGELFGQGFVDCLGKHHIEAIEWHWEARTAFLEGRKPDYLAYFPIWSRGNAKSFVAERMVVVDGILSFAYKQPGYAIYICHEIGTEIYDTDRPQDGWIKVENHPTAQLRHGDGYTIEIAGVPNVVLKETVTPEHRYWARRIATRQVKSKDAPAKQDTRYGIPHWIEAQHVDWNTWIGYPIDTTVNTNYPSLDKWNHKTTQFEPVPFPLFHDPDFWWLVGLWWGDGTLGGGSKSQISLSCGDAHPEVKAQLKSILDKFGYANNETRPATGALNSNIYFCDVVLSRWLQTWTRGNSRKTPPQWVEHLPLDLQTALLQGYFAADGHTTQTQQLRLSSVHLEGLLAVRRILARLGVVCMVGAGGRAVNRIIRGRALKANRMFHLIIEDASALGVAPLKRSRKHELRHVFIEDGWMWSKVRNITPVQDKTFVPIQTESETYLTHFGMSHNCKNKDKVQEHVANIEFLLSSEAVRKVCPELSNPKRTEITNQQRKWTSSFLKTEANYSIQGGTLDSGLAGSRVEDTRPTFLVPDDIDSREDSPVIAENRFIQLTRGVLPMRQHNTLVFFAQNLISRFSVMYRIHTGQARVLTNRKPAEPVPAVYDLVTEQQVVDGIVKDVYVSGTPSWSVWNVQRIQDEIDTEGLESFLIECQHQVSQSKAGLILYNYDDNVHVISESEFASVYGSLDAWLNWRKKPGNDWARTKTDKHANVAGWWTVSSEDTPVPNHKFLMYPMSFPADSAPEDVAERLLSVLSLYAYDKVTWAQLRVDILRRANVDVHAKTVADKIAYERQEIGRTMSKYSSAVLQRCNVQQGDMSHEQDTIRKIYSGIYGLGMKPVNPKKHGGTEAWNREMRIDREMPNPFRPDELGYSQWHLVVPDDKTQPYREVDGMTVYRPKEYPLGLSTKDMWDDDLCRFHLSNCRYRPPVLSATGEEIDVPEKIYDDFFNLGQMAYVGNPLTGNSLTTEQKVRMVIPVETRQALATATTAGQKFSAAIAYEFEEELAKMTLGLDELEDELDWE